MRKAWTVFYVGCRAAVWKATSSLPEVGLSSVVAWAIAAIGIMVVGQYVSAGQLSRFDLYGINSIIAWNAIVIVLTALIVRPEGRVIAVCMSLVLSILADLAFIAVALLSAIPNAFQWLNFGLWTTNDTEYLIAAIYIFWNVGAMLAVLRSVEPDRPERRLLRVAALWLAIIVAMLVFPHRYVFDSTAPDRRAANWWEYFAASARGVSEDPQRPVVPTTMVELRQPLLLEGAASKLAPQRPGVTDVYAIGVAGYGNQNVFVKELDGGLRALAKTLPIENRVLRLINNPETVLSVPIATRQNFAAAVRSVAKVMDRDEDVLILFMTSHGSPEGVALQLSGLAYGALAPDDVAATLSMEGIRHRIVIVSACYSGVFVPPLATDNSIVITAADAHNTSFGCSDQRDWTYFGEALFDRALHGGGNLKDAYKAARVTISEWEARDKLPASNPQGHFGSGLMQRLTPTYLPAASNAQIQN